ncbi:hypothetical protein NW762_000077 [Fusarium torreyae]|uniref:Uncharacterized protein n=1 Tax=Fusarium torreyae TaxID=1237075 RepID=A0A9W8SGJ2_9HYPO|nr:hypothetical protein NW762_000077 [Fusarium torreyae]
MLLVRSVRGYVQVRRTNEAQTVVVQFAMQDIYQVAEDVPEIRLEDVEARFICCKEPVEPDAQVNDLNVVIQMHEGFKAKFKTTLSRVTKSDTDVKLFFSLRPKPNAVDNDGKKLKDTDYWNDFVLPIDFDDLSHSGDLVLKEKVYLKLIPSITVYKRRVALVCHVFKFEVPGDNTKEPDAKSASKPDDESGDEIDSESDNEGLQDQLSPSQGRRHGRHDL